MITKAHDLLHQDAGLLAEERERIHFILVDEFQDVNFAQVRILQMLAGKERNVFAVGDPDQAVYRFRGASSAALGLFQRHFPGSELIVLDQNRRSTTPILECAYAVIGKNPDIFSAAKKTGFSYRRSPLRSAREADASRENRTLNSAPVEVVILADKDMECFDVVAAIGERQRQLRCRWSDFAVLYRQHSHRDEIAMELAEQNIPFSIENMDVTDTPEVRDLFAVLGAVVSSGDGASLFRVAALPQFQIDPEQLRAAMRSIPRDAKNSAMALVLAQIKNGAAMLQVLEETRKEIAGVAANSQTAVGIIMRRYGFDPALPSLQAVLEFVGRWQEKRTTKTGEIAELLEYLEYFGEARGAICLPREEGNTVRLMTAHAAKGLEFDHVFIVRASSPSFPAAYREPLVEFPLELRDADSQAPEDDKLLHEQEERRLFYVAMTRARDFLTIHAKQGTGKHDKTPPGYLRELLKDLSLGRWLRQRPARGFQTDLFGAARVELPVSPTTQWLSMEPASDLSARLSASAVQTYQTCPLQFKIEREWKIPGEVPAAMQYGATIHRVLHAYYDSVRAERPITDEALIELFRADLASAGLQDGYQHELYEKQGVQQLQAFLAAARRSSPCVLHTEERFEIKVGATTLVGRIDRIDQAADGQVAITDYKTGKPLSQEDADKSLQLSIYALAAQSKWGYRTGHLAIYNLEENSAVFTERNAAQLEDAKHKVQEVAANIAAGNFAPKPDFHCRFCAYRSLCPATEKRLYTISVPALSKNRST
jgi:DNA helicase-2/ATP-dependent DNA helicase PcrA